MRQHPLASLRLRIMSSRCLSSVVVVLLASPTSALAVQGRSLPRLISASPSFTLDRAATPRLVPVTMVDQADSGSVVGFAKDRAAGLAVAGTIGFFGEFVATRVPIALSPLLYATAFGIIIGNLLRLFDPEMKKMEPTEMGMAFAKRRLLRAGIILYGAKITFAKILGIGLAGLLTDLYVVSSTLLLGFGLGRLLGLSEALTTLISTGSAICGCSAVAATQPIINAEAHEVAAAVGVVVLCGTSAMFLCVCPTLCPPCPFLCP